MKLRDWINLTGIYLAIFGLKGILLLMDRAARRILPPQTYCYTWKSESETLPNTLNIVTNINSELTDYEKLFTSEKGKIIANGKHEELVKNSDVYKSFYEKQIRKD